ncbi:MAG: RDD family protein [Pseudomonadota bacterium]
MHTEINTPGLWRRMACWLYEGMLMFAVAFFATWLFSTIGQMRSGMDPRRLLLIFFLFVIFGIYFTWFWSKGQTLAMKTWNIRVVGHDGKTISQLRAFGRYCLSLLWFLPPLITLSTFPSSGGEMAVITTGWVIVWALLSRFHPQGQFWHDALAGTRLISSQPMSR